MKQQYIFITQESWWALFGLVVNNIFKCVNWYGQHAKINKYIHIGSWMDNDTRKYKYSEPVLIFKKNWQLTRCFPFLNIRFLLLHIPLFICKCRSICWYLNSTRLILSNVSISVFTLISVQYTTGLTGINTCRAFKLFQNRFFWKYKNILKKKVNKMKNLAADRGRQPYMDSSVGNMCQVTRGEDQMGEFPIHLM